MGLGNGNKQMLRIFKVLEILGSGKKQKTTLEILNQLERDGFSVSKKTIGRDLKVLEDTHGLRCDKSDMGTCSWSLSRYKKDKSEALSNDEALTFYLVEQHLKGLLPHSTLKKIDTYFQAAKNRLNQDKNQRGELAWAKKIRVIQAEPKRLQPRIIADVEDAVYDALLNNRQLEVVYQARSKKIPSTYTVNVLGLVSRGGMFYVICHYKRQDSDAIFPLALQRFISAKVSDLPNHPPLGFDLDTYLIEQGINYNIGESISLKATVAKQLALSLEESPLGEDQILTSLEDGLFHLNVTVLDTYDLRRWLMGCGEDLEVLEPVALRDDIRERVRKMLLRYET